MFGVDGRSFDQRQQIALDALARDIGAAQAFAAGNLVSFVEENDAVLLDGANRFLHELLVIEQLVGFLVDENIVRFRHGHPPRFGAAAAKLAENVADIDGAHLCTRHTGNLKKGHARRASLYLDFDFLVVDLSVAELLAEALARGRTGARPDEGIEHTLLRRLFGAGLHILALPLAGERDADLDQVAHNLLDIAADVSDLGEFGRFDFQEGRAGQPGKTPRYLRLADTGRADHQNILRQHFLAQLFIELQTPPAV